MRRATLALALALGCSSDRTTIGSAGEPQKSASEAARPSSRPAASAPEPAATTSAERTPAPKARAPGDLLGDTVDFPYDAADIGDPDRAYVGRAFIPDRAAGAEGGLPLVVFFHGLNRQLIPHRWMGGGTEGDVRRIVGDLVAAQAVAPVLLAAPGSIRPAAVSGGASFPVFDFDRFLDLTERALEGRATLDRARVVVVGHSGAGCSERGGIVSALASKTQPHAVVSVDTCMPGSLALALGAAPPTTHVVVTWQDASWPRSFDGFRAAFAATAKAHPPAPGVLRELDVLPPLPKAHDATVKQTFDKYLPRLLPPAARP